MESTWESRDLPVLAAVVDLYDEFGRAVTAEQIVEVTGLSVRDAQRALFALADEQPAFFVPIDGSSSAGREIAGVTAPTGYARRTVGAWPTPEALVDRMVAALNEAADQEPDPGKQTKLRSAASALAGVARDVAVGVVSGVIVTGSMG